MHIVITEDVLLIRQYIEKYPEEKINLTLSYNVKELREKEKKQLKLEGKKYL